MTRHGLAQEDDHRDADAKEEVPQPGDQPTNEASESGGPAVSYSPTSPADDGRSDPGEPRGQGRAREEAEDVSDPGETTERASANWTGCGQ